MNRVLKQSLPDKNGTIIEKGLKVCSRCGGSGIYVYYSSGQKVSGICFLCNGKKEIPYTKKVFTKEYQDELDEKERKRELKRQMARIKKNNKEIELKFGPYGSNIYLVKNENAYSLKSKIKLLGGKFNYELNYWYFKEKNDQFILEELKNSDFIMISDNGNYFEDYTLLNEKKRQRMIDQQEFFGEIGDKICCELSLINVFKFDNQWGTVFIYKFTTIKNECLIWQTSSTLDWEINKSHKVSFTIKEHSLYGNEKQTKIIRLKIIDK